MATTGEKLREWNLNTILVVVGFVIGAVAWGVTWGRFQSDQASSAKRFEDWRTAHEQQHRDAFTERKTGEASLWARINQQEKDIGRLPQLEYRVTVSEQQALSTIKAIETLQTTLNALSADIRVIREIQELNAPVPRRTR